MRVQRASLCVLGGYLPDVVWGVSGSRGFRAQVFRTKGVARGLGFWTYSVEVGMANHLDITVHFFVTLCVACHRMFLQCVTVRTLV